jgi:hypothetical protein
MPGPYEEALRAAHKVAQEQKQACKDAKVLVRKGQYWKGVGILRECYGIEAAKRIAQEMRLDICLDKICPIKDDIDALPQRGPKI